jgi:hypothetical protein
MLDRMRRLFASVTLALLATSTTISGSASTSNAPPRITRATGEIRVDARLDETAWQDALVIALDYEWFPGDNTPAPVRTEARLTFDDENLYVAFQASDPDPSAIRAFFADRDTAFQNDTVGFVIDPFNDGRRAFQFRVNPLGVQMEAVNSDVDGSEDWSWDIIWESVGRITSDGYVVEIAVPFSQLRFPRSTEPQTWGFLVTRDYPRSSRHRLRSKPIDRARNCFVCQLDPVVGFEGMRSGRNVELTPTLTTTRTDARAGFPDGEMESGSFDTEAGATVRWGITPDVTVNAALNPDFSQVEADAAQLNVNERFAIFYPEKRPFFLEGADFFATPIDLVFTRTIADPSVGLKVTGKRGASAFGAFAAADEVNNLLFPGFQESSQTSIDQDVDSLVARYRRDVGRSNLGILYTGRVADGYSNHVGGLDTYYRLTESDTIRAQAAGSSTEYALEVATAFGQPTGRFSGLAFEVDYDHQDRDWFWSVGAEQVDSDFRADSGFLTRVAYRELELQMQRTWWAEQDDWYDQLALYAGSEITQQLDGDAEEWSVDLQAVYQGPLQSVGAFVVSPNREYFDGVHYDNFRWLVLLELRPWGSAYARLQVTVGETIDFTNSRQAEFVRVNPLVGFNVGRRVEGSLRYVYEKDDVETGHLFTAQLAEARLLYHFSLRTFVRAILQWRDVERTVENYTVDVPADTERLFTQFLFSYKLTPQSVVFVGYSDNYLGDERIDLTQSDRTLFAKVGYTWAF